MIMFIIIFHHESMAKLAVDFFQEQEYLCWLSRGYTKAS